MYARFHPEQHERPRIEFTDFTLRIDEIDDAIQMAKLDDAESVRGNESKEDSFQDGADEIINTDKMQKVPDHVLSVKSLSDARRNQHLNTLSVDRVPESIIYRHFDYLKTEFI